MIIFKKKNMSLEHGKIAHDNLKNPLLMRGKQGDTH